MKMLQIMETTSSLDDATETLDNLRYQEGFRVGRLLAPSAKCAHWQVQAFMEDVETEWLPDGMRRVWAPWSVLSQCS